MIQKNAFDTVDIGMMLTAMNSNIVYPKHYLLVVGKYYLIFLPPATRFLHLSVSHSVYRGCACHARPLPCTPPCHACPPAMHALPCHTHTPAMYAPCHARPPSYYEMRSMSGRYTSYWNAFLFIESNLRKF